MGPSIFTFQSFERQINNMRLHDWHKRFDIIFQLGFGILWIRSPCSQTRQLLQARWHRPPRCNNVVICGLIKYYICDNGYCCKQDSDCSTQTPRRALEGKLPEHTYISGTSLGLVINDEQPEACNQFSGGNPSQTEKVAMITNPRTCGSMICHTCPLEVS